MKDTKVGTYYVAGVTFSILLTDKLNDDNLGAFAGRIGVISLSRAASPEQIGSACIHEVIHACHYVSPDGEHTKNEERCVRGVEAGFAALLGDPRNAKLLDWIREQLQGD